MSVPRRTMAATLLLASLCVWPPHVGGVAGEAAELRLTGLRSTQNEKFSAEPGDSADRGQRAGVELSAREIGERSGLLSGSRDVFPGHAFPTLIQTSNSTTDPQESGGAAQPNPRAREKLLGSNMSTSQRGLTNDPLESATLQIPPDSMDGDGPAAGGRGLRLWPELGLGVKEADRRALPTDSSRGWGLGLGGGASQGILGATQPRVRTRRSWIWNQFFVIEEYVGPEPMLIGRLHSSVDKGDGNTKYILKGEGAGSVFVIDGRTGNIHVTKPLDREEKDQYRLIATATDLQTGRPLEPSSQFVIRVQDINDNAPVFRSGPYSATVPEMANIGTSVIQVTASDADDPSYGNSAKLVYTVLEGQELFSVDPQTGVIRTAAADMDRERQDRHLVVLQARDMGGHQGGLTGTTTVTVWLSDVNDNPPRFAHSVWSFSVSELAMPGVEVGRLSATDADLGENARLEYAIVDGDGGDAFNVTTRSHEAVITLNKAVDFERRSSYTLNVEVQNPVVDARFLRRGPFKDRATVQIAVLNADEPPRFSRSRYRMDVSENCPPACVVGRVAAVDPDTGQSGNIRYSIDPESDPEALFRIAPDNGLITTAMELDREREQWHNITVIATQRDSPSQLTRVGVSIETLDLNDNAPELDRQYATAVCDSSSPGAVVQVLHAVDRDLSGSDSPVHFSIPSGSGAALNFSIRGRGGATASLVLLSALKPLPRSASTHALNVPVVLQDASSELSSTGTVTVTVCPCLRGGMWAEEKKKSRQAVPEWDRQAECLPLPSASPLLGLSTAAVLAVLACATTLLVVAALSLSLRKQKRDALSPAEDDEIHENIITYDDEGGGEADTAAFDILALKSAPHSALRTQRRLDSRTPFSQRNMDSSGTYSWSQNLEQRPGSAPLYGRAAYGFNTLPVPRDKPLPFQPVLDLGRLPYGHRAEQTPVLQTHAGFGPPEPGSARSRDGPEPRGAEEPTNGELGSETNSDSQTPERNQSALADPAPVPSPLGRSPPRRIETRTSGPGVASPPTEHPDAIRVGRAVHKPLRTMEGTLYRGGPLPGALYSDKSGPISVFALGGEDYAPHLVMPFTSGILGYGGGWSLGKGTEKGGGANLLTLRMGDFLQHRLAQVTLDPMQPPYDSVQTYGVEGSGSHAGSLSSLGSDVEREAEPLEGVVDGWGAKFQKLVEIFHEELEAGPEEDEEQTPKDEGCEGGGEP